MERGFMDPIDGLAQLGYSVAIVETGLDGAIGLRSAK